MLNCLSGLTSRLSCFEAPRGRRFLGLTNRDEQADDEAQHDAKRPRTVPALPSPTADSELQWQLAKRDMDAARNSKRQADALDGHKPAKVRIDSPRTVQEKIDYFESLNVNMLEAFDLQLTMCEHLDEYNFAGFIPPQPAAHQT